MYDALSRAGDEPANMLRHDGISVHFCKAAVAFFD